MPHFYMNVYNNVVAIDEEGIERADLETVMSEAVRGARALIAEHIQNGKTVHTSHRIEIADDAGKVLHTVRFGDIVDIRP
ncbi:hypothetical protein [Sphingomonas sp. Ant20]|uniref:DUF6894 family protein n=1 Tax=Sphingomonas sp. Ant20 TaxID=104605 RepID=UPI000FE14819|nr:hypothetical protein [Sphingomonas sp. Ant20]